MRLGWEVRCVDYSTTPNAPPAGAEFEKICAPAADGWMPFSTEPVSQGPSVQNWRMWFRRALTNEERK